MNKKNTTYDELYQNERHSMLVVIAIQRLVVELELYSDYYWDTSNGLNDIVKLSVKEEKFSKEEIKEITNMALEIFRLKSGYVLT